MNIRIAISGKFCSGKTTMANKIEHYFRERYNNITVKRVSFADEVKQIAKNTFLMKNKDRQLLQSIGKKMREIDQDVFCKHVIHNIQETDEVVILDDLRYENEMVYLKNNGFKIIRILINTETQKERISHLYPNENYSYNNFNHESEVGLDNALESDFDIIHCSHVNYSIDDFMVKLYNDLP